MKMACKTWTIIQMIFTISPPSDGDHNRRFVSIHLSEEENKDAEEQKVFKN
jgi:hypothetical protein